MLGIWNPHLYRISFWFFMEYARIYKFNSPLPSLSIDIRERGEGRQAGQGREGKGNKVAGSRAGILAGYHCLGCLSL